MSAPKKPLSLDLDSVQLTVAENGYVVYADDIEAQVELSFVFETWDALSVWLFTNMAKPVTSKGH